ncbi:MAG: hypothetical protein WKF30_00425 [Pyrinomonadaceae bacterium]
MAQQAGGFARQLHAGAHAEAEAFHVVVHPPVAYSEPHLDGRDVAGFGERFGQVSEP